MTLLVDPPVVEEPTRPTPRPASNGAAARWRFAGRLARREVRRRPGRTVLVAALISVPVLGMTLASVLRTSIDDPWAETFARRNGPADIAVESWSGAAGLDVADLTALLPEGSTTLVNDRASVPLRAVDGGELPYVHLTDLDIDAPLAAGVVDILDGSAPRPGEVLLDPRSARDLGVEIGDELDLARPAVTWTVSGIGRLTNGYDDPLAVVGDFDFARIEPDFRGRSLRIDLPPGADVTAVASSLESVVADSGSIDAAIQPMGGDRLGDLEVAPLAWGWVAGTVALAAVGIIIAAAFATSARRQLATIGQLSANGASDSLVRRTLAMQGSWSGLAGAIGGVLVAGVVLLAGRPLVISAVDRDFGGYDVESAQIAVIVVTAVVAATIAALIPARSASRIPVLAALAGRRPLTAVTRRWAPIALTVFGGGLLLLVAAALASEDGDGGNLAAAVAVVGGLAVLGGLCAISPLAVDTVRHVPARGSARLATRSLVRQRTRSAAVVTAIATVGTLAVAGATFATRIGAVDPVDDVPEVPADTALVQLSGMKDRSADAAVPFVAPDDVRAGMLDAVPGAQLSTWRIASFPLGNELEQRYGPADFVIADDGVLEVIGLSDRDGRALDDAGLLAMHDWSAEPLVDARTVLTIPTAPGEIDLEAPLRRDLPRSWGGYVPVLLTPAKAAELGWEIVDGPVALRAPDDLTRSQRSALRRLDQDVVFDEDPFLDPVPPGADDAAGEWYWYVNVNDPGVRLSQGQVEGLIVAAALLLTIVVVAIGLALAAAESRDERDVLVAIGARPALLRRLAAERALVLTVLAGTLAIPTGYLPVAVVVRSIDDDWPTFTWLTAASLLVAVPLVAAGAAWLASAIAQKVRPVRMSTLAVD